MSVTNQPHLPTTREIRDLVGVQIAELGGTMSDCYDDGERLYLRTILPPPAEVRPGDAVRGGVAVRVVGPEISVHPYTFRQVCSNGAIRAQALQTRQMERVDLAAPTPHIERVAWELGEAVRACAAPEAFAESVGEMRSAAEHQADQFLSILAAVRRLPGGGSDFLRHILAQLERERDRSAYGLMNALTAVARETREPEARWRLEELGGGVPARLTPRRRTRPPAAAAEPAPELVGAWSDAGDGAF